MDAPHQAQSGHQGTAMSLAPLAHVLWTRIMKYDASAPAWMDRDRFVLSAGHASILQYAMLYLTGHGLTLDDVANFRQWGSPTPGHPEVGCTPGVEVTTGPLGQGIANAVGMAIAETQLRARTDLCDHYIYVIAGDGDLSEGVSHEAASLAGHLGLGRLIVVYDDNRITIDGGTDLALSDDAAARFAAYGWHTEDLGALGDNCDAIEAALRRAKAVTDKPSLLVLRTEIGAPAPQSAGTAAAHGYAMFDDEIAETKKLLGLPSGETFYVPKEVLEFCREKGLAGVGARESWEARLAESADGGTESLLNVAGMSGWEAELPAFDAGDKIATRVASQKVLSALLDKVPAITGGSADLTGNTGTKMQGPDKSDYGTFAADDPTGRQIYFGVREHAMGAIANGMALHGGALPVVGTFLVFADYMRPALRLAALSEAKAIFVFTHDSVGVGEDGPTHQPIEQVASLRAIPGLTVIRPADATETAGAWRFAVEHEGPTALILTRQGVPVLTETDADKVTNGAYVVSSVNEADVTLLGTGSEVSVCVAAAEVLAEQSVTARVVSMPSWERFEAQSEGYRTDVLGTSPILAVEAGTTLGWHKFADDVVGIDRFGASAPGDVVMEKLGISPTAVAERAKQLLNR